MKDKSIFLLLMWSILYFIVVGIGCAIIYNSHKNNLINLVDKELTIAAKSFDKLIIQKSDKSEFDHLFLVEKNTDGFISKKGLNSTHNTDDSYYKTKDFNLLLEKVFITNTSHFFEKNTQNIRNRISIIPIESGVTNSKVLVSQKNIEYIYEILNSYTVYIILIFSFALLILIPILAYILIKNKNYWKAKVRDSNIDSLTGIPNHNQLINNLENTHSPNLAFIKILNYNSYINEYGPAITDNIIKQFVTVLSGFEDPRLVNPSIYRVQQTTFAILEDQDISLSGIADITGKIIKTLLNYNYMVGENEFIKIKVTVGACKQKKDAFTLANMALSEAIEKQLPYFFIGSGEKDLPKTYKKDLRTVKKIKLALEEDRLVPFFQPIFNAKTLKVEKYESLARIVDDNNNPIILPNKFLPLINREKLSYKITRIILNKSINFAIKNNVVVSINIGIQDINNAQTCDYIFQCIKDSNISQLLQFEILENEAIVDSENVIKFIRQIQKLGCQIGMDDLGKGYSNFERLINLPVNFVKIDRSIIEHLVDNLEIQNLTKGIIRLAHKKKIKVIAEYCANKTITDLVIMLGADMLQGHYFSDAKTGTYINPKEISKQLINH